MATIVAAVIGAAGAATSGVMAAQGARAAGRVGTSTETVPLPGYADALNHYMSRLVAGNVTSVAPTFTDWVSSGGRATFPLMDTGMTPREAGKLGFVDPRTGQEVPFVDPNATKLTPEQVLYLGQQNTRYARTVHGTQAKDPASRYYRADRRLENLNDRLARRQEAELPTARLERKIGRVQGRKQRLEDMIFSGQPGSEE